MPFLANPDKVCFKYYMLFIFYLLLISTWSSAYRSTPWSGMENICYNGTIQLAGSFPADNWLQQLADNLVYQGTGVLKEVSHP